MPDYYTIQAACIAFEVHTWIAAGAKYSLVGWWDRQVLPHIDAIYRMWTA